MKFDLNSRHGQIQNKSTFDSILRCRQGRMRRSYPEYSSHDKEILRNERWSSLKGEKKREEKKRIKVFELS